MHVAVCVKQVPDHEAIVRVESEQSLNIEDRYVCSFFDEIAIEAALNIKKAHPDTQLTALSVGGRRAVEALRRAMAMGIDDVIHLGDESFEQAESLPVARVLAEKLGAIKPDLVMCGKQAGHDDMAAVGPMIAELLGMPHVNAVVTLDVDPSARVVNVGRKLEGEIWMLTGAFPVLIGVEKGLAEPHIPLVTRVMKAMKAKIENQSIEDLGLQELQFEGKLRRVRFLSPPTRPAVKMLEAPYPENVDELVRCLQENGILS